MRLPAQMTRLASGLSAACLSTWIAITPASAVNLLQNGGAEFGNLTGWTPSGAQVRAVSTQNQQSGTVTPYEGSYFFTFAWTTGTFAQMTQSDTTGLASGNVLTLNGYVSTEDMAADDFGVATIRIVDGDAQIVATASSPQLTTASQDWQAFEISLAVPPGAASWEVVMSGTREYGTYINVFWDALVLTSTAATAVGEEGGLPDVFGLHHARPNPFNLTTTIKYALPSICNVQMAVFGVDGRRVRQLVMGTVPAGTHQVTWDGRDDRGQQVAAGVYFYRLTAGDRTLTKKMVLIR